MSYKKIVEELVKKGTNNIRKKTVILNDDKPIFEKEDFNIIEGNPKYFGIDKYGRVRGGIALISKNTIPLITDKELEYPRPYGWNKNMEKVKDLFESCHIIAYNLSAQNTVKENLFIGTKNLNRSLMKNVENDINDYVKNNNFNVLYKVTIKYNGTDQIPTGILTEAQAIGSDFSVCKFCYNVEKYIKFDYSNGVLIYDHRYLKKTKNAIKKLKDKIIIPSKKKESKTTNKKQNYVLDIKNKICHYDTNCEELKEIEPKYIQGTRTTEKVILDSELKICNKCKNKTK